MSETWLQNCEPVSGDAGFRNMLSVFEKVMKKYSRLSTIDPSIIQYGSWKRRSTFGGHFSRLNIRRFTSWKYPATGEGRVCVQASGADVVMSLWVTLSSTCFTCQKPTCHLWPSEMKELRGSTAEQRSPSRRRTISLQIESGSAWRVQSRQVFHLWFGQTVAATGRQCCIMALCPVVHSII